MISFFLTLIIFAKLYYIFKKDKYFLPYFFLMGPFAITLIFYYIQIFDSKFKEVDSFLLVLWILCSFFFLLGSGLVKSFKINPKFSKLNLRKSYINIFCILTLLILVFFYFRARDLISFSSYDAYILTDQFIIDYFDSSLIEFSRSFIMLMVAFLLTLPNKNILAILTLVASISLLIFFQIKGMILQPILAGLIMKYDIFFVQQTKKLIIPLSIFVFLIFTLFYYLPKYITDEDTGFNKVTNTINNYVFAGVLAFDYNDNKSFDKQGVDYLLCPFNNLLRRVTGWERVSVSNDYRKTISVSDGATSNVRTIFGTIFLHTDLFITLLSAFIIGVISRILYQFRSSNIFFKISYSFLGSVLFFGFFEYYFWHQYIITLISLPLLIGIISTLFTNENIRPTSSSISRNT